MGKHLIDRTKFSITALSRFLPVCNNPDNEESFRIIWLSKTHEASVNHITLVGPYRNYNFNGVTDGIVIAFKKEYLEEDDKEYALDVFRLFNMQGQYAALLPDESTNKKLHSVFLLMEEEYGLIEGTYLIIKALLKVFLSNLVRINYHEFLSQDINQKRVYHFIALMDENYLTQRKVSFYSETLGISEKRLNQILQEKMNRTATQLLHLRLINEAKRQLKLSELSIKEIAVMMNFEDRGYFTRFFKKQTGTTPETYRKSENLK